MTIEIKFRAWQDNEMIIMPISGNYASHKFFGMIYEDAIVMQYTGLKDKNGVEIYEGDIVKWDDKSNGKYWRVAVVEIKPDIQFKCIEYPLIPNFTSVGHIFNFGNFIYTDTHNHLTVIGNIHEKPELL